MSGVNFRNGTLAAYHFQTSQNIDQMIDQGFLNKTLAEKGLELAEYDTGALDDLMQTAVG